MERTPDGLHQHQNGTVIECPACGAPTSLVQIVIEVECGGGLEADDIEVPVDAEQPRKQSCAAELTVDLVWSA